MTQKLNQVIAVEKGTKSRIYGEVTELHKLCQKPDMFNGFTKTYQKLAEEDEELPMERKKVQLSAEATVAKIATLLGELFDVTLAKDKANCYAMANVVVDGVTVLSGVPATYLLFLEKQLTDLRTFIDKLPVLDEAEDWTQDQGSGLFKTATITTHRSKKVAKPLVLYQATEQHPAQTQLISMDVVAGYWNLVKHSGALPAPRKAYLIDKIETLLKAVKYAREEANSVEAPTQSVADGIFRYLLS